MKLQMDGQRLRLRIGEDELRLLLDGAVLQSRTQFADAFTMQCTLELTEGDHARIGGGAGSWQMSLPRVAVKTLAGRLPSREGLSYLLNGKQEGDSLTLLFDVDVRDSVKHLKRRG